MRAGKMDISNETHGAPDRTARRSPWEAYVVPYGGPLLAIAVMLLIELLYGTPLRITNPGVLFIMVCVWAGFIGGTRTAIVCALLGFAYVLYYFSAPGRLFEYAPDNLNRIAVLIVAFPTIVWLVGTLKSRIDESLSLSDALNRVSAAINSTLDFDEIMNKVVTEVRLSLGVQASYVTIRQGAKCVLRYASGQALAPVGTSFSETKAPLTVLVEKSGHSVIIDDAYADERLDRRTMERYGFRSYLAAPLRIKNRTIGVLGFAQKRRSAFGRQQPDFISQVAVSVSLALENAQLYAEERSIAATLQQALLAAPIEIPGVEIGYLYHSATTEAAEVGGDFYDVFQLEHDRLGLIIGDVSGKGLEAATLTSLVKYTMKAYAYERASPAAVLARLNEVLVKTTSETKFTTTFYGVLDIKSGLLTYCRAGHPPALLKKPAGVMTLDAGSPAIGALGGLKYTDNRETLNKDDVLVLYTDGVIEARRDGEFFGEQRLMALIQAAELGSTRKLTQTVFDEVQRFTGGELRDDVAILTISLR